MDTYYTEQTTINIDRYFSLRQKLTIKRSYMDDEESYTTFVTEVDNKSFYIELPLKNGHIVSLKEKKEIEISSISPDAVWRGMAQVKEVSSIGAWVNYPKVLKKVQCREYKRWDLSLPIKVAIYSDETSDLIEQTILAKTKDISCGGLATLTADEIPKDKVANLVIDDLFFTLDCKAKIVYSRFDILLNSYVTGYQFINLDDKTINRIHGIGLLKPIKFNAADFLN
ncbi:MAG: PilZ domain-containing protein [bacterium]